MHFDYHVTKSGTVRVSADGREVVVVAGARADRLSAQLAQAPDEAARQLLLARATGNFRRGNERSSGPKAG